MWYAVSCYLLDDIVLKGQTHFFLHGIRYFDFSRQSSTSTETHSAEQALGPVRTPQINVTKLLSGNRLIRVSATANMTSFDTTPPRERTAWGKKRIGCYKNIFVNEWFFVEKLTRHCPYFCLQIILLSNDLIWQKMNISTCFFGQHSGLSLIRTLRGNLNLFELWRVRIRGRRSFLKYFGNRNRYYRPE